MIGWGLGRWEGKEGRSWKTERERMKKRTAASDWAHSLQQSQKGSFFSFFHLVITNGTDVGGGEWAADNCIQYFHSAIFLTVKWIPWRNRRFSVSHFSPFFFFLLFSSSSCKRNYNMAWSSAAVAASHVRRRDRRLHRGWTGCNGRQEN